MMATSGTLNTDLSAHSELDGGKNELNNDCFGRLGSQIDDKIEFKDRYSRSISGYPVIIDFRRVLQLGQTSESNGVISGVSNRDLLHAVVGLYDICLPDMDTDTIYTTVTEKWSRTIVIAQDLKDATDEYTELSVKRRNRKQKQEEKEEKEGNDQNEGQENTRIDAEEDVYKEEDVMYSAFKHVYSDTEEEDGGEDDDEEEEEEEENYSKGIHSFIEKSLERQRKRNSQEGIISPDVVGIENRILACATFEKKFVKHKDRVIHLTLIGVRPRYRKFRIGRYLLSKCVNPTVVGNYDAVVVHADNSAVDFFGRFGFSDDIILNNRWKDLAEAFTNCTLMTYLPAFSGHDLLPHKFNKENDMELYEIEQEIKNWQEKSQEAHQSQLCCLLKLRNEIFQLKNITKTQNSMLSQLLSENDVIRKEKLLLEKKLMNYRLVENNITEVNGDEIDTDELIRDLESQVTRLSSHSNQVMTPSPPPVTKEVQLDLPATGSNSEIISRFLQSMEQDRSISVHYTVTSILRRPESSNLRCNFEKRLHSMSEPQMVAHLYYCGSLERPSRLGNILSHGFSQEDFSHGEFGRGLYFSKYPSKAAQFSALGKLLEVQVAIGNTETVMRYDRTRQTPSPNYDSIITPGRLYRPGDQGDVAMLAQEYVIFDATLALPACVLSYTAYAAC